MATHPMRRLVLMTSMLLAMAAARAQGAPADAAASPDGARPKVALVLSGGGARGFAHVGVLRALREMRVPVDMVVGVSMGAVVGGAYASGLSVEQMEDFVRTTRWGDIVSDRVPRDDLAFRQREEDLLLPSRVELGVTPSGIKLPLSAAVNATLEATLNRLLPPGTADTPVNRLPLPFRSVASDLLSGELIELRDTPLFMSIRASLAVPGVFAPVRLVDQRLVVDGGLVRNLPVDIARAMGADIIIAVNVGTPLAAESELGSALGVARQMLYILTEQNVQRSLKELTPRDVLIAPDLNAITFLNFALGEQAMAAGAAATRQMAPQLAALAVPAERFAAFEQVRTEGGKVRDQALPLARLVVRGTTNASSEAMAARLGLKEGEPVSAAQVRQGVARLEGRGEFERVSADIHDVLGQREVTVDVTESDWARSRLRLGVELASDFRDDSRFTLSAMHVLSWANSWGAEWRTLARIGSERLLLTQFWQPLAPGSPWYVMPTVIYNASAIDAYQDGRRILRLGYHVTRGSVAFGRELSNWGRAELGAERRVGGARQVVPDIPGSNAAGAGIRENAYYADLAVDTLDSLALPTRGILLQNHWERVDGPLGGAGRTTFSSLGLFAFRIKDWAGHTMYEWARSGTGLAPLSLGGFLRLSGTPRESVADQAILLTRLVMARRVGEMPAGLGGAVRVGYSLELGGAYDPDNSQRFSDFKKAGSAFVSVDTRFGPMFLAAGATRGGNSSLYLFLGPFW